MEYAVRTVKVSENLLHVETNATDVKTEISAISLILNSFCLRDYQFHKLQNELAS